MTRGELFVPDLPPGSTYHLAFLTEGTTSGIPEFQEDYDDFVNSQAATNPDLAGIEFRSVATTAHDTAANNASVSGPVFRLDGVKIADNNSDLWDGSLDAPLNVTQNGAGNRSVNVWTGSGTNGRSTNCTAPGGEYECTLGLPDPSSQTFYGISNATNGEWLKKGEQNWTRQSAMYAISVALMIPELAIPGDFDGNEMVDAADIDLLGAAIRNGSTDPLYDLNSSGAVEATDVDYMLDEVLNTWAGDANLDGEFNSADFVFTFIAGEYEDGVPNNSGWADGDWNLDTEFDTADLVYTFQRGGFELGPKSAVAAVPEPATGLGCLIGLAALAGLRRRIG